MTMRAKRKVIDTQVQDLEWAARQVRRFVLAPSTAAIEDAQFGLRLLSRYVRLGREQVRRGDGLIGPARLFR